MASVRALYARVLRRLHRLPEEFGRAALREEIAARVRAGAPADRVLLSAAADALHRVATEKGCALYTPLRVLSLGYGNRLYRDHVRESLVRSLREQASS